MSGKLKNGEDDDIDDLKEFDPSTPWTPIDLRIRFGIDITPRQRGRKLDLPPHNVRATYYKLEGKDRVGVRCLKCNTVLPRGQWNRHNMVQHNNVAWRDGDVPIDMSNRDLVVHLWNLAIKIKLPLKCELCGTKKLSAIGFLSHILVCGKSNEVRDLPPIG